MCAQRRYSTLVPTLVVGPGTPLIRNCLLLVPVREPEPEADATAWTASDWQATASDWQATASRDDVWQQSSWQQGSWSEDEADEQWPAAGAEAEGEAEEDTWST